MSCIPAPDRKAVEDELVEREIAESDQPGFVQFVINGLQIQIEQYVVCLVVVDVSETFRLSWQAFEVSTTASPFGESEQ